MDNYSPPLSPELKYRIRNFSLDDCQLLPALLFKTWKRKTSVDFWKWKYGFENGGSQGWTVENEKGEIVSLSGLWTRKAILLGNEIRTYMIVDMMADPDHRGYAYELIIGKMRKIINGNLLFGFTNPTSHRIYRGVFRKTIKTNSSIPVFCTVLNPCIRFPLPLAVKNTLHFIVRKGYQLYLRCQKPSCSIVVTPIHKAGEEYDDLCKELSREYTFLQDRGSEYLNWRFGKVPSQSYTILQAIEGSRLIGYIVIAMQFTTKEKKGLIVDWLVSRSRTDAYFALTHAAMHWFISQKADIVLTWVMKHEKSWIKVLRSWFFFKKRQEVTYLLSFSDLLHETKEIKEEKLFLTMGDSDYAVMREESREPDIPNKESHVKNF